MASSSLVINTNSAATVASVNLNKSNAALQKSLNRLSSGSKIVDPSDNAGGLAVASKMQAAVNRTNATNDNISNAISFLQTQDGALRTASEIIDRISELRALHSDPTKSSSDKANYETEFDALKAQLTILTSGQFNGVNLFGSSATGNVVITEDGQKTVSLSASDLKTKISGITAASNLTGVSASSVTTAIQNVANLRANNGAITSRLNFASEMLSMNAINLKSAVSRIMDTDVASESTELARFSILTQAGSSMLAQANSVKQVALKLLG